MTNTNTTKKGISQLNKVASQIKKGTYTSKCQISADAAFTVSADFFISGVPCFISGARENKICYIKDGHQMTIELKNKKGSAPSFRPLKELFESQKKALRARAYFCW